MSLFQIMIQVLICSRYKKQVPLLTVEGANVTAVQDVQH